MQLTFVQIMVGGKALLFALHFCVFFTPEVVLLQFALKPFSDLDVEVLSGCLGLGDIISL